MTQGQVTTAPSEARVGSRHIAQREDVLECARRRPAQRLEDVEKVVRDLQERLEIAEELIDHLVMWFTHHEIEL